MENKVSRQLQPWCDLEGKVVLVTGASAGLGRQFCTDLAKAGCYIVAAARRANRLSSLCDEINEIATTTQAVAMELDVTAGRNTIEGAAQKAWAVFGRIDVLINNAGIRGGTDSSLDISEDEWEDVFNTNLNGAWMLSKYIGRHMREVGKGGSIINISSGFGLDRVQQHGSVAYSSSKAGMNNMTKVMALELGRSKIRVNAIAPAIFPSELTAEIFKKKWFRDVAMKIVPLQTSGTSDPALTSVIRYLIHDSSQYVTGNIFIVDCGATLTGVPIFSSL
ncbi:3-oxoacyl-[acyl-carrier-protein] reductase 3, chloroplastic [Heracleum sosnowskyi]|uniref:3-oxoacyl-[acyl-carrier-protein] reductase 3, chloroplastic n=1 Tax=Heracleum sosnowskyi TaxID=360622 RepID=A0AAD8HGZ4_9APIA|nr:3-oxoacyl-[acyl-carrier-protein] reductase 3, chloroplastic [Heracleum sosnowskyi]